jgi:hypothetical protein
MRITETLLIYLIIGAVVAIAMPAAQLPAYVRWTRGISHAMFWPFFAPGLLGRGAPATDIYIDTDPKGHPALRPRLYRAKARLLHAIATSTNLSDSILQPQVKLIDAVMASLDTASERLREMDAVLTTPEFDRQRVDATLGELRARGLTEAEPRVASLTARKDNIERLVSMRAKTSDELERALFTLEAISSRVLLLKFADNPESRLEGLLAEVTESIGDLSSIVLEMSEL